MRNLIKTNKLLVFLALLLFCAVGSELFARFVIGAGNPVIIMDHPAIGYMVRPSQSGAQLHNTYYYNCYGMRSEEFAKSKSDSNELRVLVIGDSIIAGGVHTDQNELATTLLKERLEKSTGRPVVVANISCGGWAPQNQVEYIRNYGTFDADIAIWVLSSHDYDSYAPNVSYAGSPSSYPLSKPFCASTELLGKAGIIAPESVQSTAKVLNPNECFELNKGCFKEMADIMRSKNIKLLLVQHLTMDELANGPETGCSHIAEWADENNVARFEFSSIIKQSSLAVDSYYRDNIHINAAGQAIYADAMFKLVQDHLN